MMKFLLLVSFSFSALAYVPTVESLYRHGSNPDVTANGIVLNVVIKKLNASTQENSLMTAARAEDFYKIFFTKNGDSLKVAQVRYSNASFTDNSIEQKVFYPNFSAFTMRGNGEQIEKGLFFSILNSTIFNNGAHVVNYLKSLGVPVRLNNDLINREKIEYLASYKRYLALIARDKNARKTEQNPLRPDDSVARARIESIMAGPLYVDTKQVKLSKDDGEMAWVVDAGNFRGVVSYRERNIQKMIYKSQGGDLEMICKDYWLADGTHSLPRFILIKTLSGDSYQVEFTSMKQYVEYEDDLVKRLNRWDQLLKGKTSNDPRPEFML